MFNNCTCNTLLAWQKGFNVREFQDKRKKKFSLLWHIWQGNDKKICFKEKYVVFNVSYFKFSWVNDVEDSENQWVLHLFSWFYSQIISTTPRDVYIPGLNCRY